MCARSHELGHCGWATEARCESHTSWSDCCTGCVIPVQRVHAVAKAVAPTYSTLTSCCCCCELEPMMGVEVGTSSCCVEAAFSSDQQLPAHSLAPTSATRDPCTCFWSSSCGSAEPTAASRLGTTTEGADAWGSREEDSTRQREQGGAPRDSSWTINGASTELGSLAAGRRRCSLRAGQAQSSDRARPLLRMRGCFSEFARLTAYR